MSKTLSERLQDIYEADDHSRLCQGREYACTCGFDERTLATAKDARAALDAKDVLIAEARDVIEKLLRPRAPFSASAIEANGAVVGHARVLLLTLAEATK